MRWPKTALTALGIALIALIAVLAFNTARLPGVPGARPAAPRLPLDEKALAERLAAAIRIPTVSFEDKSQIDLATFERMAALLETNYPNAHRVMTREVINGHSLLFTWPGKDPAAGPALFLAHMDVVPVEPGTESLWLQPAFSGAVSNGYVWGRGTLDDKVSVIGLMEAAESLAASGWQPARTVLFAFGHDEEISGLDGAAKIAETLKARGVKAGVLLDEGGAITIGLMPGVKRPVAAIMAAEKGYASFKLTAKAIGGHSSTPPPDTAASSLARAIVRLQDHPMPARIAPPVDVMLERAAPAMSLRNRVVIANRWLFEPLLLQLLRGEPVTNALIRTTTAPTILRAGVKDNVLPAEATAVINFRLLPGDSVADVERHIRSVIGDDAITITQEAGFGNPASPVSDASAPAFRHLGNAVLDVFPDALVSTGLVVGATDARHYAGLYDNRYNFLPVPLVAADLNRIHGANERIAIGDFANAVRWYRRVLETLE